MVQVMGTKLEPITLSFSREVIAELPTLSAELNEQMHYLLERNTDGSLSDIEKAELTALVQMAQFAELLAMAAEQSSQR